MLNLAWKQGSWSALIINSKYKVSQCLKFVINVIEFAMMLLIKAAKVTFC